MTEHDWAQLLVLVGVVGGITIIVVLILALLYGSK